jgi:DNA-binding transcriptional ArsR family regulator
MEKLKIEKNEQVASMQMELARHAEEIAKLASAFDLIGNKVRFQILYLIFLKEENCVRDLSDVLNMTRPAISQHIQKLKHKGVIEGRKEGTWVHYSIKPRFLSMLEPYFEMMGASIASTKKQENQARITG